MASIFPSLSSKYSTFRNDLPFFVWQRYFTSASLPLPNTCSKSNRSLKLICVSPDALLKVKLSASRTLNRTQSFFSSAHVLYHFRMIASFAVLDPVPACALAVTKNPTAPASAQAPVSSSFRRDTAILVMSILLFQLLALVTLWGRPECYILKLGF